MCECDTPISQRQRNARMLRYIMLKIYNLCNTLVLSGTGLNVPKLILVNLNKIVL
jgi:hypothetical protein